MELGQLNRLRAGNVWCRYPVVEIKLVFGEDESRQLPRGVRTSLRRNTAFLSDEAKAFPAWQDFDAGPGDKSKARAVAAVALLLQRSLYWPVTFSTNDTDAGNRVVIETRKSLVGRRAAEAAVEIVATLSAGTDDAGAYLKDRFGQFQRAAARATPAFDTLKIVEQADARGIPWESLRRAVFVRLGTGPHSKMLYCSESSALPLMARRVAKVKPVTSAALEKAGLPVPKHRSARTLKGALSAAKKIGGPIVVKPAKGRQGQGVTAGIETEAEIEAAVARARKVGRDMQIEAMIPGQEYRLLVIGGQFVAASQRLAAQVTGDGMRNVAELVRAENNRPERFAMPRSRLSLRHPIMLDDEALACLDRQGLSPDTVPDKGTTVALRSVTNVSQGGVSIDVTDSVHPSVREIAERAARALKLDACGVDFITTDITRPFDEAGGAICEMNTQPGLSLHHVVEQGRPRDVFSKYLALLYPEDAPVRLPTVILIDPPSGGEPRRAVEKAFVGSGKRLGVYRRRPASDEAKGPVTARSGAVVRYDRLSALLASEDVDAALVVLRSRDILRRGAQLEVGDFAVLPEDPKTTDDEQVRNALELVVGPDNLAVLGDGIEDRIAQALGLPPAAPADEIRDTRPAEGKAEPPKPRKRKPRKVEDAPAASQPAAPEPEKAATVEVPAGADGSKPEGAVRAVFVGDMGFGESYVEHPRAAALKSLLATRGHSASMERVAGLFEGADLVVGNLEVPLSWKVDPALEGRKRFLAWSDPDRTVAALSEAGFSAFSLANNHALDGGPSGVSLTRTRLAEAGMEAFGGGDDETAAAKPLIRELGPATLVVFGGFARRRHYASEFDWYAGDGKAGVAALDPTKIGQSIAELRQTLTAPIFVAYPHWGADYQDVTERQAQLARDLVAAGVDLVIGHGAHILQRVELIDGHPVAFGLGNFVWNAPGRFAKTGAPPFGAACALDITAENAMSLKFFPVLTDTSRTGFRNRPVTSKEFREVEQLIAPALGTRLARRGTARRRYLELVFDEGAWRPVDRRLASSG